METWNNCIKNCSSTRSSTLNIIFHQAQSHERLFFQNLGISFREFYHSKHDRSCTYKQSANRIPRLYTSREKQLFITHGPAGIYVRFRNVFASKQLERKGQSEFANWTGATNGYCFQQLCARVELKERSSVEHVTRSSALRNKPPANTPRFDRSPISTAIARVID